MRIRALATLFLLGSCGSPSIAGPDPRLDPEAVAFVAHVEHGAASGPVQRPSFRVVGGDGEMRVEGFLTTPMGGYTLEARGVRAGSIVRLEVIATQTQPGFAVAVQHWYHAAIGDLPPGTYQLQLVHRVHGRQDAVLGRRVVVN